MIVKLFFAKSQQFLLPGNHGQEDRERPLFTQNHEPQGCILCGNSLAHTDQITATDRPKSLLSGLERLGIPNVPSKHRHTEEAGDDGFNKIIRQVAEPAAVRPIRRLKRPCPGMASGQTRRTLLMRPDECVLITAPLTHEVPERKPLQPVPR
jgi:hypothetical protein